MALNTNVRIPFSKFLDETTGRPSREWMLWLMSPDLIQLNLANAIPVTSGGTGTTVIPANGQILIGNGSGYTVNYLTAGTGISITYSLANITIGLNNSGVTAGSYGTTSSVAAFTVNIKGQVTAASTIPIAISASQITSGVLPILQGGTGASTAATARANLSAAVLGANNDITSMTGVTGGISTPDYVSLDSTVGAPTYQEGRIFYDPVEKTLAYYNDVNGITLNVCQEEVIRIYNNTGSTISNGQLVYINGANGGFPTVAIARSDSEVTSKATIGMCTNAIANATYGYITTSGTVHDLNTNVDSEGHTLTNGDVLYLSATVAGGYTNVAPIQPNYDIQVGYVIFKNATTGKIYVHIDKQPWFPNMEVIETGSAITLPSTPTVFVASTAPVQQGVAYDTTTGIVTFNTNGSYSTSITFNATPPSANKFIYFYVERDTGAGWQIIRYTARALELINGTSTQVTISSANFYKNGDKLRFYIWGSAAGVTLNSTDLPGTTAGTVTLPAFRYLVAG